MPIRFRCKYCHQLLGIARRKSGKTIQCPTCHGKLNVPVQVAVDTAGGDLSEAAAPLFEQNDFDDFLDGDDHSEEVDVPVAPSQRQPAYAVNRLNFSPPPPPPPVQPPSPASGVTLSSTAVTILTVSALILLALAFGAGIAVDRLFL
jgi:hypothetical protein